MRWIAGAISFLCAVAVVGGVVAALWAESAYRGAGPAPQDTVFTVARGEGVAAIAGNLAREGLIGNALLFRVAARWTKADTALHAGEYEIAAAMPMAEILRKMAAGDVLRHKVTVREGLTSWQVVRLLDGIAALTGDLDGIPAEGSLLPETYHYTRGDTRQMVVAQMEKAMTNTLAVLWPQRHDDLPLATVEEAVILASIVEKETSIPAERAKVAGVFINRLRQGMPLQTDPTVIYALTGGEMQDEGQGPLGRRLLRKDLQLDSPYNTYKYAGLPPGPIANPGRDSLRAVLQPERHDYLYFVADGAGGHAFGRTLSEHNANVARWRAHRRETGN